MTSLNPVMTIGRQIAEVLLLPRAPEPVAGGGRKVIDMLAGWCAFPETRAAGQRVSAPAFPGGMRQRAPMIAMGARLQFRRC